MIETEYHTENYTYWLQQLFRVCCEGKHYTHVEAIMSHNKQPTKDMQIELLFLIVFFHDATRILCVCKTALAMQL